MTNGTGTRQPAAGAAGPSGAAGPAGALGPGGAHGPAGARDRPWVRIGFQCALGVLGAYLLAQAARKASTVLVLMLLAVFVAVSVAPVVDWLCARGLRRGLAVTIVAGGLVLALLGSVALLVPLVVNELHKLIVAVPAYLVQAKDKHTTIGRLDNRFHVVTSVKSAFNSAHAGSLALHGVLGAGAIVVTAITSTVIVSVLALYLLAGLPGIMRFCYRLVPASRRTRSTLLIDEILRQVGRYMLGNVLTSVIAGLATFIWLEIVRVPYAAALGVLVAILDLIPIIGSSIGGAIATLIALTVSLPVALATLGFYVGFRLAEDYLLMPKVMRLAADVPPIVSIIGVSIGGALLGIVGALVAIPVALAIKLLLNEVAFPRLDAS